MRLRDSLTGELREREPGPDGTIGRAVTSPTISSFDVFAARPIA